MTSWITLEGIAPELDCAATPAQIIARLATIETWGMACVLVA
ncbi:MAG: hypothetical protein ABI082_04305 [Dokdonella sp.]